MTRLTKVEFPTFEENRMHEWIFKFESFFELDNTPPDLKVSMASVHLTGLAMEWHYVLVKNRRRQGPTSWLEYVDAMVTRFGPMETRRPIAQLKKLREEDNYFAYVDAFLALISQVSMTNEDQVAMFSEGLKQDNKKFITILNPRNLQLAISMGKTLTIDEDPYREGRKMNEQMISVAHLVSWSNAKQQQGGVQARPWNNTNR